MLISWRYNFVFIHIPKTGGTAVTDYFAPFARLEDRVAYRCGTAPFVRGVIAARYGRENYIEQITGLHPHAGLPAVEKKFGAHKTGELFKFCFVRNPFTHAVSHYQHILRNKAHPLRERIYRLAPPEGILQLAREGNLSQIAYLPSPLNNMAAMDFIGCFENLDADIEKLTHRLRLPKRGTVKRLNENPLHELSLETLLGQRREEFIVVQQREFELLRYSTEIERAYEPRTHCDEL